MSRNGWRCAVVVLAAVLAGCASNNVADTDQSDFEEHAGWRNNVEPARNLLEKAKSTTKPGDGQELVVYMQRRYIPDNWSTTGKWFGLVLRANGQVDEFEAIGEERSQTCESRFSDSGAQVLLFDVGVYQSLGVSQFSCSMLHDVK